MTQRQEDETAAAAAAVRWVTVLAESWKEVEAKAARMEEVLHAAREVQADLNRAQERARREKAEAERFGIEKLVLDLTPALDAFERSLATIAAPEVAEGVRMVEREILRTLAKFGVSEIAGAEGRSFDPSRHEAVDAAPSDAPAGTVLAVLKRGFALHDRVLRPAQVRVSRGPGKG